VSALEDLLVVQEHDAAIDRLRHRLGVLPERAALAAAEVRVRELAAELAERREELAVVSRNEHRLDGEAQAVGAKADEVDRRLYSGEVSSPKELQALQADLDQLRRQRSTLEDEELEVMEQREALDAAAAELDGRLQAESTQVAELTASVRDQEAAIATELAAEQQARAEAAATVPPAIVTLYEEVRARNGGIGAARLVGDTCQGCRLSLPAVDLARLRALPPDEVGQCEHCEAVLIRS
jgi:uncharacterized protein